MAEILKTISTGKRNLIINGDMSVNQRGHTNSSFLAGLPGAQYVVDRWQGWFPSTGTYTNPQMSQSSRPSGFPGRSISDTSFRMIADTVDALGSMARRQRIEARYLKGLTNISFGFHISTTNFQDCTIQLIQNTAGDDTWQGVGSGDIVIHQVTESITDPSATNNSWDYFEVKDIPLTNTFGLEIRVTLSNPTTPGGVADSYLAEAMCNGGNSVEQFQLAAHGNNFDSELTLCKRYYERTYRYGELVGSTSDLSSAFFNNGMNIPTGNRLALGWRFTVTKRATPTLAFYNHRGTGAQNQISQYNGDTNAAVTDNGNGTPVSVGGYLQLVSGTIGDGVWGVHIVADAEL